MKYYNCYYDACNIFFQDMISYRIVDPQADEYFFIDQNGRIFIEKLLALNPTVRQYQV